MCGIVIVRSCTGACSMEGTFFEAVVLEDGGMFSESEDSSGGLEEVCGCFGLFRRAHTESISIVAPEALEMVLFFDSSL